MLSTNAAPRAHMFPMNINGHTNMLLAIEQLPSLSACEPTHAGGWGKVRDLTHLSLSNYCGRLQVSAESLMCVEAG